MSFLFGGARTTQPNTAKTHQREIQRHVRTMERENQKSLAAEKTIIAEIKKAANASDIQTAKMKARELIRSRNFRKRLLITQQSLSALAQKLSLIQSTQMSQEVLLSTTKILQTLNAKMDLQATYKMLMQFQKENDTLDERQEISDETLDQMFEIDDSEVEDTLSSVFEELGLDLSKNLKNTAGKLTQDLPIEERFAQLLSTHPK